MNNELKEKDRSHCQQCLKSIKVLEDSLVPKMAGAKENPERTPRELLLGGQTCGYKKAPLERCSLMAISSKVQCSTSHLGTVNGQKNH